MSIFKYAVKQDVSESPMYGTTKKILDFDTDKEGAIKWADTYGRYFQSKDNIYVEEKEYACEENLKKDFPIYTRHVWTEAFHGYSEIKDVVSEEELNDVLYNLKILANSKKVVTWEQIAEFLHYVYVDRAKDIVEYLRSINYVSYNIVGKKIKNLKVIKEEN